MPDEPFTLTNPEFDLLFERLKNWGRWGDDDDLGALNFIGEKEVVEAARLVKTGRHVSLARALDTVAGPDNGRPALHYMTNMGDKGEDESAYYADFIGVDFHGKSASHLDALPHVSYKGLLYNGKRAADVFNSKGSNFAPVSGLAKGIVARGVLLDAAHARRVDWVEPPCALDGADLEAIGASLGVEVGRGDVVLLRTGQVRRRRTLGPWDPDLAQAGLATSGLEWLAQREIAVLGGDGDSDAAAQLRRRGRRSHPRLVHRRTRHVLARQPGPREPERSLPRGREVRVPPHRCPPHRARRDRVAGQPDRSAVGVTRRPAGQI